MDDCVANFPEDIVKEILLRCPVKSLLRFKCVHKNWYALIKTPNFVQQHLNCSKNNPPQLLLYNTGNYGDRYDSRSLTLISEENPQTFKGMAYLLGSVNGLFLMFGVIDHVHSCALWNPATREVRLLHLPPPMINDRPVFGLGLDLLTNDYKVVCYLCENLAAVYSCSRDSWRIFKHRIPFFTGVKQTFGTAYSNGVYYWLLRGCRPSYYTVLLFDFGSEMFEGIEGPHIHTYVFGLMLVDDSIAILSLNDLNMSDYAIWVMIQPGVWNKLVTFQCFPFIKSCYDSSLILATRTSRLISYNVRTNKLKDLAFQRPGIGKHAKASGCGVFYYNESLVTIKQRHDGELDH
ncbi:hypothetical protein MTR67_020996 [Solanum verrucosum]|uniref:F-box domain-containing protein n=1 Tax=Solanum verrucosum TaxID=315347 RepID=A0AAF0QW18_SOLVR|nr:F-box protein CPR1-like [Solanum verrucosum]WMV27611.1 hypothetical protein MTR67_020996 [Solanum verrucosum]